MPTDVSVESVDVHEHRLYERPKLCVTTLCSVILKTSISKSSNCLRKTIRGTRIYRVRISMVHLLFVSFSVEKVIRYVATDDLSFILGSLEQSEAEHDLREGICDR